MKSLNKREIVLVGALVLALLVIAAVAFNALGGLTSLAASFGPSAPVIAAGVATASLVVAAVTTWGGWRRSKRQATIEAWSAWSDACYSDRVLLSKALGPKTIESLQATSLTTIGTELVGRNGPMTAEEKQEVGHAISRVLNGLERLAVGVENGIYDVKPLRQIGGTIIVRTFERLEPYIIARRESADMEARQRRVFKSLGNLVDDIRRKDMDAERLTSLRN
jgi:hypothetical protein